jgi:hypothetical protein
MAEDHQRTQASPEDLIAQFKAVIQEQRKKQDNLRYVHQFLTSSQFIDLRDADLVVSDQPEAIAERKADLDYRIKVLGALLTMLQEERTALDRTKSVHEPPDDQPDTPPLADAESGDAADAGAASTGPSPEPATPEPDAPHSRAPDVQPPGLAPAAASKPKRSSRKSSASVT